MALQKGYSNYTEQEVTNKTTTKLRPWLIFKAFHAKVFIFILNLTKVVEHPNENKISYMKPSFHSSMWIGLFCHITQLHTNQNGFPEIQIRSWQLNISNPVTMRMYWATGKLMLFIVKIIKYLIACSNHLSISETL